MDLTILFVVLLFGIGVPLRNKRFKDWKKRGEEKLRTYVYVAVDYQLRDFTISYTDEHRKVIEEYAALGYRYVGMIPTEMKVNGCIRKMDLIFEIEE